MRPNAGLSGLKWMLLAVVAVFGACSHRSAAPSRSELQAADVARGKAIFTQQCAACHGNGGAGGPVGPVLRGEATHHTLHSIESFVEDPQPPMPKLYPGEIDLRDVRDVSAYVESLH